MPYPNSQAQSSREIRDFAARPPSVRQSADLYLLLSLMLERKRASAHSSARPPYFVKCVRHATERSLFLPLSYFFSPLACHTSLSWFRCSWHRLTLPGSILLVSFFLVTFKSMPKGGCTRMQPFFLALSHFLLHHVFHALLLVLSRDSHVRIN